ncbi:MAG: low-specificity L-threonine aldolase [Chloroflexota bacterium]|nr:low-specificity L-threonine aldolase [Chloroflexota bacterium]MDE2948327.1 low-specificity L-threonine aldolase [Chloroflexota bacterium]
MDYIDLRSDTVSHPTPAMREAMARAAVGDDVYHDDPTVNQLEAEAAAKLGKEAAVFVTSGTQGNLCALLAHCQRGESIIIGDTSHIFRYEQGGMAQVGGIVPHTVPVQADATMRLCDLENAINPDDEHKPVTRLVALENTHNAAGGLPISAEYTAEVAEFARRNRLMLHIDGARIFNAAAAFAVDVKELVAGADSVTFCLSKGLCAPVGSVLAGEQDFIQRARRARKALGGSLRQAGVLAAAGLIGLQEMTDRLIGDHQNAQLLAEGLSEFPGVRILSQNTNFIYFSLAPDVEMTLDEFVRVLREDYNIRMSPYSGEKGVIRLRTHYWIDRPAIAKIVSAVSAILP